MAKRGRKTKLTPAVIKRIRAHKGEGLTDRALARVAGVGKSTFYEWIKKAPKAKSSIYRDFRDALEDEEAAVDTRITNPLMAKVDEDDMKAIETAMKRHPRLKSEFKEEPTEVQAAGNITFVVPKEIKDLFE
jgi:hypothetical protein